MDISKDTKGNRIYLELSKVYLKLASERYSRCIGTLSLNKGILFIKRSRSKHLHRKSQSYGFNYRLLNDLPEIQTVCLQDEFGVFELNAEQIKQDGQIMNFFNSKDGNQYELQYFVKLSVIEANRTVEVG